MPKLQDPIYLLKEQYDDASKLNARLRLHIQFSTNPYDWFLWVFDQFDLPCRSRLLELGCGPGDLWLENIHRIPDEWEVTVSDFSAGMLQQAQENLQDKPQNFEYVIINAQSIPCPNDHFHGIIANHVFHHVPCREEALSEIRRVLKRGGHLYATSAGEKHLIELPKLVSKFDPELADKNQLERIEFTLESGYAQLSEWFSEIKTLRQENSLLVTEAEPLVDYVLSSVRLGVGQERREELTSFIERELEANDGSIPITKDGGIFIAQ
jgi:ubiquinone/menaquinone biosynthesis C-methylase UbiE